MRIYTIFIFFIALFFEITAYFISLYREKLNDRFIASKHDLLSVAGHHILAILNVLVLIIGYCAILFYIVLLLTGLFSLVTNEKNILNPVISLPFSIILIVIIIVSFISFEIIAKKSNKIKGKIDIICRVYNLNSDEKMGMIGNLRQQIILYIIPATITLFLITIILGIEYV